MKRQSILKKLQALLLGNLFHNKQSSIRSRIERDLRLVKSVLAKETIATNHMLNVYYDFTLGKASKKEMVRANKQFQSVLKTLGLGFLVFLPFSVLTIPFLVKIGKKFNIHILPDSFQKKKIPFYHLKGPPRL